VATIDLRPSYLHDVNAVCLTIKIHLKVAPGLLVSFDFEDFLIVVTKTRQIFGAPLATNGEITASRFRPVISSSLRRLRAPDFPRKFLSP